MAKTFTLIQLKIKEDVGYWVMTLKGKEAIQIQMKKQKFGK